MKTKAKVPEGKAAAQRPMPADALAKDKNHDLVKRGELLRPDYKHYTHLKEIVELFSNPNGVSVMELTDMAASAYNRQVGLLNAVEATMVGEIALAHEEGIRTDLTVYCDFVDSLRLQLEIGKSISDALYEGCKRGADSSPAPSRRGLSRRAQRMLYQVMDKLRIVEKLSGKQFYVRELI